MKKIKNKSLLQGIEFSEIQKFVQKLQQLNNLQKRNNGNCHFLFRKTLLNKIVFTEKVTLREHKSTYQTHFNTKINRIIDELKEKNTQGMMVQ